GVDADGQDLGVGLVVEGNIIACVAQLFCACAREGLREKEKKDVPALEIAERHFLFIRVVESEIRCLLACLDRRAHIPEFSVGLKDRSKSWTQHPELRILAVEKTDVGDG